MSPKLPSFHGDKDDPNAYFEWEKKLELYFDQHRLREKEKLQLIVGSLHGRAKRWWYRFVEDLDYRPTWKELRRAMRKKFAPHSEKSTKYSHIAETNHKFQYEIRQIRKNITDMENICIRFLASQSSMCCAKLNIDDDKLPTSMSADDIDKFEEVELIEQKIDSFSCTNLLQESTEDVYDPADLVEEELEGSSKIVNDALAIVPYKGATHDVDPFLFPCFVPSVQVFKFELPILIHMPKVQEVLHNDFVFGDRHFYHMPTKEWCFDNIVVRSCSSTHESFVFLFIHSSKSSFDQSRRRASRFVDFIPRILLKIRGRIFSKKGRMMRIHEDQYQEFRRSPNHVKWALFMYFIYVLSLFYY